MPPWVPARIQSVLPADWEVVVLDDPSEGTGDGALRVPPFVLAAVQDADVYMGYGIPEEILRAAPRLRWAHSGTAGVWSSLTPSMRASSVVLTNSAGVHAVPIAETVLGMILYFGRGLDLAVGAQTRGTWETAAFWGKDAPMAELSRGTVGVLGFGGLGREVAWRAAALGARVLGLRRREGECGEVALPPTVRPDGRPATATVLRGSSGLETLLAESDYLVLAAPHTAETLGMLDRHALARMKPSAVLINVARGALVDEEALVELLTEGRLRGAALDVFSSEPLAEGHALWKLPNVLLMPHVSAVSHGFWEREAALIVENLRRFLAGEPLLNEVDKRAGY